MEGGGGEGPMDSSARCNIAAKRSSRETSLALCALMIVTEGNGMVCFLRRKAQVPEIWEALWKDSRIGGAMITDSGCGAAPGTRGRPSSYWRKESRADLVLSR